MKTCPKCKKEFSDEDEFCDECGGKLEKKGEKKKADRHEEEASKKSNKSILIIGTVILVIVIGSIVFLTLIKSKPKFDINRVDIDTLYNEISKLDSKYDEIEFEKYEYPKYGIGVINLPILK